jgi:hypothetical protein
VAIGHGWEPAGLPLLVNRTSEEGILEIGGRPAAEVYEEQLGRPRARLEQAKYSELSLLNPLGIVQSEGPLLVRVPHGRDEAGRLITLELVPAGCAIQVMRGTPESLLSGVPAVACGALQERPSAGVLLAFSCCARQAACGERIAEEAARLQAAAGDVPTFGFYTYGEFGRTRGVLGVHNATITALAL